MSAVNRGSSDTRTARERVRHEHDVRERLYGIAPRAPGEDAIERRRTAVRRTVLIGLILITAIGTILWGVVTILSVSQL